MKETFVIDHVSSFVIQCTFCETKVRKDVIAESSPRARGLNTNSLHEQAKKDCELQASHDGWKAMQTTRNNVTLNLCPDHATNLQELGLIE